jgi:hypothetical protein
VSSSATHDSYSNFGLTLPVLILSTYTELSFPFVSSAENILLTGALQESDWWEDDLSVSEDSKEVAAGNVSSAAAYRYNGAEVVKGKRFRNRGLETWLQTREAWNLCNCQSTTEEQNYDVVAKYPSQALKKDLVKSLGDKSREFSLPRRLPLSAMVDVYTEIWNGSGSD